MRNRAGMNTSVVFGFTKFLRDIQKREHPDLLGVAFDPKGGSFRREIFPEYKANRAETPEDILLSVPYVKRIVEAMCIPVLEVPGYEADDVIGTLAHKGVEAGYDVFMVTPDKDYGQLVCDNCKIYKQKGNDGIEIVGREAIREKYGIENPQLVRDILALWGDASDNIPGVPGIGEKTACKLVQEWGTVENILQNADRIKSRQGEKIAEWGDKLLLAKRLTTICLDVPIDFREEDLTVCAPRIDELKALFAELDFRMFLNDLTNLAPAEPLPEGPRSSSVGLTGSVSGRSYLIWFTGCLAETTIASIPPPSTGSLFSASASARVTAVSRLHTTLRPSSISPRRAVFSACVRDLS